jgi:predicted membrane protein
MPFRYYTNLLSQASRTMAATIMVIGLLLIGFALLILALPALFAFLAAAVFFLAGCSCAVAAVKMFQIQRQLDRRAPDDADAYRENVVIHRDDFRRF